MVQLAQKMLIHNVNGTRLMVCAHYAHGPIIYAGFRSVLVEKRKSWQQVKMPGLLFLKTGTMLPRLFVMRKCYGIDRLNGIYASVERGTTLEGVEWAAQSFWLRPLPFGNGIASKFHSI